MLCRIEGGSCRLVGIAEVRCPGLVELGVQAWRTRCFVVGISLLSRSEEFPTIRRSSVSMSIKLGECS